MALPYCLAYCRDAAGPAIAEIGSFVGTDNRPEAVLTWLLDTTAGLNIPLSLSDIGISEAAIAEMAVEIVSSYPRPNSPAPLEAEPLQRLLTHFHSGDVKAAWDDPGARPRAS
jgi:alcohol dehydrogenase class IV